MLKIKAWAIIEGRGTKKKKSQKLVFGSRKFTDIVNFLENRESALDRDYWKTKRTKIGIVANKNDQWIAYRFCEIKVLVP